MPTARNRTIALLVTLLVLGAGCSDAGSEQGPTAPLATAGPSEEVTAEPTPTPSPDPYAIPEDPADIDAAYVERVLEALSIGYAEATREVVARRAVTNTVVDILKMSHTPKSRASVVQDFRSVLRADPSGRPLAPNPTPAKIKVTKVIHGDDQCIYARALQDLSGLVRGGGVEPFPSYYYLVRNDSMGASSINPTPWLIAGNAEPLKSGKEFANPCAADS